MRAVVQRVSSASVTIDEVTRASIATGLLVLVAFEESDSPRPKLLDQNAAEPRAANAEPGPVTLDTVDDDIEWLAGKIVRLRIFNAEQGLMNRSVADVGGDILVVSQFTLFASTKKGNRPSFIRSARPDVAVPLYEKLIGRLAVELGKSIHTGEFGANMKVALVNDGPVTILIDTKARE